MIGKQIKGAGFRGVLNYMEAKVKEGVGQLLNTNMMNDKARNLANEFGIIRSLNPGLKKAVYHCSLAVGKDEILTDDQFKSLAQEYLQKMGFGRSQYVMYRHYDREHPHIHIIANRIDIDGKVVSDKWDYRKSEKVIRELEIKYDLSPVLSSTESKEASLSKGQIELYRRTGTIPAKKQIQIVLREAMRNVSSINAFEKKLAANGVSLQYHKNNQNKVFGISFELEGQTFKGSTLGKGYSWTKINNQIHLNNERIRRSGQEIDRRAPPHIRWSGRTLAKGQHHQHPGIERGVNAYNYKLSEINNGSKAGVNQFAGTAEQSDNRPPDNASTKGLPRAEDLRFEKNEAPDGFKNDITNDHNWIDYGNFNFSNPLVSSGSMKDDDDFLPKKKRKKGKRKDTGMSL